MLVIPVVKRSVPSIASSSSEHELEERGTALRSVPSSYDLSDEFTPNLECRLTLLFSFYALYCRLAYELILVDAISLYLFETMWF